MVEALVPTDYRFHPVFHPITDNQGLDLDKVIRVPAPFIVQREKRPQRGAVRFHYDFLYVLELTNPNANFLKNEYAPLVWADCAKVQELVAQHRVFPDVLDAYQRVLQRLPAPNPVATH